VPIARFHLAALYAALHAHRAGDVLLPHQAVRELAWWAALRQHASMGQAIGPALLLVTMDKDTSTMGWGAVLDGVTPARGLH